MELALQLPNNYVEIEQEEMMYLDGGWSGRTFASNARAVLATPVLAAVGRAFVNFLRGKNAATLTYAKTLASQAVAAAKIFWALPIWAKLAGFAAGAAVIYAMGKWQIF